MFLARLGLLVKIAHATGAPGRHGLMNLIDRYLPCEQLGAYRAAIGVYISRMVKKRKHSLAAGKAMIASVHKEMQKPRLTMSVRSEGRDRDAPVTKQPGVDSEKAKVSNAGRKKVKTL
jgi:hypothetical protein